MRISRLVRLFLLLAVAGAVWSVAGCGRSPAPALPGSSPGPSGSTSGGLPTLTVHFLDIGQGDSALLQWGGHAMLIDGGPRKDEGTLMADLKQYGVQRLDWVVASHPHEDHIGGLVDVLRAIPVEHFYDSGYNSGSSVQARLLKEIRDRGVDFRLARAGETVDLGGGARMEWLAPPNTLLKDTDSDPNNNSVVGRLTYGNTRILFPGDAEEDARNAIYQAGETAKLRADVLKVAHHGSRNGTDAKFLQAVQPKYAVISCETGNSYGHPHREALDALKAAGVTLYRTDEQGTITLTTDGQNITMTPEHAATGDLWAPGQREGGHASRNTHSTRRSRRSHARY